MVHILHCARGGRAADEPVFAGGSGQRPPAVCRRQWSSFVWVLLGLLSLPLSSRADLTVFAAASLTEVLPKLNAAYTRHGGSTVTVSFASSSTLARQIEGGAQADLFIAADIEWMDYLAARALVLASTRTNLAGNALVLVAPVASPLQPAALDKSSPLADWLGSGRLALGDPAHVPAGRYAEAALRKLGLWQGVATQLAPADSVRTALMYVASGEAPLGIVYATDLRAATGVKQIAVFPADTHPPVVYPAAVVAASTSGEARALLSFLASPEALGIWQAAGFKAP